MEPTLNDLMNKIKAIAQGPNAELLRKLVDILYEREDSYTINIDVLRDVTSKLKAIQDICKAIDSQRDRLEEGEIFEIVGRISAATRMTLDNLSDPILHEID
ncbi:MAG: hypothetical protein WBW55_06225 [Desulfobaccales bacterium]